MMCPSVLVNSIGLVFDIVGALLVWWYGLPASISRTGSSCLELEEEDTEQIAKAKRYDRYARVGIILLVIGFALQLVSNFL